MSTAGLGGPDLGMDPRHLYTSSGCTDAPLPVVVVDDDRGTILERAAQRCGDRDRPNRGRPPVTLCESFRAYYTSVGLFPDAETRARFEAALLRPLPTTFRITGDPVWRHILTRWLHDVLADATPGLGPVPWATPLASIWELDVPRRDLKLEPYRALRAFLLAETALGHLHRQELVSMVPAIALGAGPGDRVLDLCAAPGSKSCQILEVLCPTDGLLVANDSSLSRCYVLAHQLHRTPSPAVLVTNQDARAFCVGPRRFDRILADVPCSGDGTIRKNPAHATRWCAKNAERLHATQLAILLRGIRLLDRGGRLVYSTCSFNPVENEAVVAQAMARAPIDVRLVDPQGLPPGLALAPGLAGWSHPKFGGADPRLERCVRMYPHSSGSGGFFIAVFERDAATQAIDDGPDCSPASAPDRASQTPFPEDTVERCTGPLLAEIDRFLETYHGMATPANLFVRRSPHAEMDLHRHIYLANDAVAEICDRATRDLRIVSSGCLFLERATGGAGQAYRIKSLAVPLLGRAIAGPRLQLTPQDFAKAVARSPRGVAFADLSGGCKRDLVDLAPGYVVLEIAEMGLPQMIQRLGFRGEKTLAAAIPAEECKSWMRFFGGEYGHGAFCEENALHADCQDDVKALDMSRWCQAFETRNV